MSIFSDYLKAALQYLLPKTSLTLLAGMLANVKAPKIKNRLIRVFIHSFKVDMKEALIEDPCQYPTFNDFFIRLLKPEARAIAPSDIISPVDGYVSEFGSINKGQMIQAKGREYSIQELLACDQPTADSFHNGQFITLYLSPKDYHRVHLPLDAMLQEMTHIPGKLFSVQPATTRTIPKLFARNERLVVYFDTPIGLMALVMVGATIVGKIGTTWHGDITRGKTSKKHLYPDTPSFKKAEEMGYFKLGSTVILAFSHQAQFHWDKAISSGSPIKVGQALGHSTKQPL